MANIKLGKCPESFPTTLTVKMLDGSEGSIPLEYKYRTRTEFAAFQDAMREKAKQRGEAEVAKFADAIANKEKLDELSQADLTAAQIDFAADWIMEAVKDWKLDVPFSREAIVQTADQLPQAISLIIEKYTTAITTGRLGN